MLQGPLTSLPADLPIPIDDAACRHLTGMQLPDISLIATSSKKINLSRESGWTAIYIYPMTGTPGHALPDDWLLIPGAPGCTLESCSFRDIYSDFQKKSVQIYGMSSQSSIDQVEAKERLHLPFDLLSDQAFEFTESLALPTFSAGSLRLIKRITLVCFSRVIRHVFYPVFPPDTHAQDVFQWIANSAEQGAAANP